MDENSLPENARKKIEEAHGRIHVLDTVVFELLNRIAKLEAAQSEKDKFSEGKDSCSVKAPFRDRQDEDVVFVDKTTVLQGKTVALLLGSSKTIVGYGTVVHAGDFLHGAPMPEDCCRVAIDEVVDENARLPFRISDEMETVGSALGTHVAWPIHLVVERLHETPAKKKVGKKLFDENMVKNKASLPSSLVALLYVMEKSFKDEQGLRVQMDVDLFGVDVVVWILKEDVLPFCNLEPITANCIVVYAWHLYRIMKDRETNDKFLFMNPFSISYAQNSSRDDKAHALSDRLRNATSKQLVLVPCNVGEHWILTIIQPHQNKVYLMDPLGNRNRDSTWKYVVDTAMSIFNAHNGKSVKKAPNWEVIKGPVQPDSKQCGFYIMRFMKIIVKGFEDDDSISVTSLFKSNASYYKAEIDEVREEWANCVISHLMD